MWKNVTINGGGGFFMRCEMTDDVMEMKEQATVTWTLTDLSCCWIGKHTRESATNLAKDLNEYELSPSIVMSIIILETPVRCQFAGQQLMCEYNSIVISNFFKFNWLLMGASRDEFQKIILLPLFNMIHIQTEQLAQLGVMNNTELDKLVKQTAAFSAHIKKKFRVPWVKTKKKSAPKRNCTTSEGMTHPALSKHEAESLLLSTPHATSSSSHRKTTTSPMLSPLYLQQLSPINQQEHQPPAPKKKQRPARKEATRNKLPAGPGNVDCSYQKFQAVIQNMPNVAAAAAAFPVVPPTHPPPSPLQWSDSFEAILDNLLQTPGEEFAMAVSPLDTSQQLMPQQQLDECMMHDEICCCIGEQCQHEIDVVNE